jgi:hypothetical protein
MLDASGAAPVSTGVRLTERRTETYGRKRSSMSKVRWGRSSTREHSKAPRRYVSGRTEHLVYEVQPGFAPTARGSPVGEVLRLRPPSGGPTCIRFLGPVTAVRGAPFKLCKGAPAALCILSRGFPRVASVRFASMRVLRGRRFRYDRVGAFPKGTRAQRFLLKPGDAVHIYSNSRAITLQFQHEAPTEVDLAATSFKAAVALTAGDALSITILTNSGHSCVRKRNPGKSARIFGEPPRAGAGGCEPPKATTKP